MYVALDTVCCMLWVRMCVGPATWIAGRTDIHRKGERARRSFDAITFAVSPGTATNLGKMIDRVGYGREGVRTLGASSVAAEQQHRFVEARGHEPQKPGHFHCLCEGPAKCKRRRCENALSIDDLQPSLLQSATDRLCLAARSSSPAV